MEWQGEREDEEAILLAKLTLADLYRKQKDYADAQRILEDTLPKLVALLDANHEHVNLAKYHLANVHQEKEEHDIAAPLFESVFAFQKEHFGQSHVNTLNTMNDLAILYKAQERYDEAERLYLQTIELRREVLGKKHPSTTDTLHKPVLYKTLERNDDGETICGNLATRCIQSRYRASGCNDFRCHTGSILHEHRAP